MGTRGGGDTLSARGGDAALSYGARPRGRRTFLARKSTAHLEAPPRRGQIYSERWAAGAPPIMRAEQGPVLCFCDGANASQG